MQTCDQCLTFEHLSFRKHLQKILNFNNLSRRKVKSFLKYDYAQTWLTCLAHLKVVGGNVRYLDKRLQNDPGPAWWRPLPSVPPPAV